jgi:hypothetical protein
MLFLLDLCTFLFCWSFSHNPFFAALKESPKRKLKGSGQSCLPSIFQTLKL